MAQVKKQGNSWVLLNDAGNSLKVTNGTVPATFPTEADARKWAAANSVTVSGVQVSAQTVVPASQVGLDDAQYQQPNGGREIIDADGNTVPATSDSPATDFRRRSSTDPMTRDQFNAPAVQLPSGRWAFADANGNAVPGTPDYATEDEARAFNAAPTYGSDRPDVPTSRYNRGDPARVGNRYVYRDGAGNEISTPEFANDADARAWDRDNPYYGGLTKDQADRVDAINAELGQLDGLRRDAARDLEEARRHSVEFLQAEVDRLRARTDVLVIERSRLLPAPTRVASDDAAGIALLRKNGWVERDGMWMNTRHIVAGNVSIPVGVTRPFDEAVGLESRRPA